MTSLIHNIFRLCSCSFMVIGLCTAVGCKSNSSNQSGQMKQALNEYQAQHYTQAQQHASAAVTESTGTQKDRANYLAGMSSYQLGQTDEAERRWMAASESSDAEIAGNSKAMLGQLRMDQGRPHEAATLLSDAAGQLKGDDSAQARQRAGIAFQQAGESESARKVNSSSSSSTKSASAPASTSSKKLMLPSTSSSSYAIQIGAFNDLKRAQHAADEADRLAKPQGLGPVRMVSRHDEHGQAVYIVQLGNFTSRDEAVAARTKLGKLEYIVAPSTGS
jgi:septal ring-binding cell division protein DamX